MRPDTKAGRGICPAGLWSSCFSPHPSSGAAAARSCWLLLHHAQPHASPFCRQVWVTMQGEMGATIFFNSRKWQQVASDLRGRMGGDGRVVEGCRGSGNAQGLHLHGMLGGLPQLAAAWVSAACLQGCPEPETTSALLRFSTGSVTFKWAWASTTPSCVVRAYAFQAVVVYT